jgi:hypothetical protein
MQDALDVSTLPEEINESTNYYLDIVSTTDQRILPAFIYPCKRTKEQMLKVNNVNYGSDARGIHLAVFKNGKKIFNKAYLTHHPGSGSVQSFYEAIADLIGSNTNEYDLFIIQTKDGVGDISSILNNIRKLKVFEQMPIRITDEDSLRPYIWIFNNKAKKVIYEKAAVKSLYAEFKGKIQV